MVAAGCSTLLGTPTPAPGSPPTTQIESLLARVAVVDSRPDAPGYQRSCKQSDACVFGPAWTDDYDGAGGHDGCGTRDNVLQLALTDVQFRPGTNDCVVVAGSLNDPFTGSVVPFTKQDAGDVQIDHTYPLAAAWDMGAWQWTLDERIRFANDITYNLMAVSGSENQSKSDKTPSDWLPPNAAYHCYYAGRYLTVAVRYDLPITRADQKVLTGVASSCS
ncbi:MAG: HNH endonuclease family protein [Rhodococcus sp. (in: high G+C Gram-positive bacteria)]